MRKNMLIILLFFVITFVMAEMPRLTFPILGAANTDVSDSVGKGQTVNTQLLPHSAKSDSTVIDTTTQVLADTAKMDSLQKAIWMHNKAIDDSLRADSINRQRKNGIDAPVEYTAEDSMTYEGASGLAHLYGQSHVKYQDMDLQSDQIFMQLDSSLVHATGSLDSLGKKFGTPIFKMGSDTYENDTIAFNFKTKKGLISDVYTQQDDGYMTAQLAKRGANGEIYLQHGRYTTCDKDHPDFYIALSRAKMRPGKDVVFGPAYLVVADVPLPFAIPYGFFPFSKSYSSGFIMPTYGDETSRGFYLRDGGYYFAINDKMDLKLLGEIYTKGSWGLSAASNYRKRYKYSGSFFASYQNTVNGEKNMPDYTKATSFKVQWSHRQDSKANPYSSLSASVNFATSSYERNNLTSMYNPQAMTQSTRTSSVSWSTTFSSIGMSLSSTFNLNQNMRDSTIALTLPDLNISISRFYPFKRRHAVGKERWYEKISMSYTGQLSNSISTKEDRLMHSSLTRDWRNGMQHSIPISGNFTLFGYLNINPSLTFTDRMYTQKQELSWDEATQTVKRDTLQGFYNVYNWAFSVSASTKLYGMYIPSRKVFGDKIMAVRHVVTPSVSFNYAPDFSASRYGFYKTYQKTDADGNVSLVEYSPYEGSLYGVPGRGKTGSISMDLSNNIEMKVKSDADSTGVKKISIIDELGASMSYNMAAEERPWSDLSTRLRLKLTKSYTLNINAVFATYAYEADSVGARPYIGTHTEYSKGRFGRFQGMSQNLSYTLDNKKVSDLIKWLKGERPKRKNDRDSRANRDDDYDTGVETNVDEDMERGKHGARKDNAGKAETDEDGYMAFNLPWSLSLGYGVTMRENTSGKFNYDSMRYPYKFTQNLNVSGNLRISDGWNISFSSGYDFENHKISMTTASLSRDLHCFNMSCSVVLAPYTSYNFSFRCNAATLTDALKYDKRSSYSNAVQWY
ncbi:kinase [Prevotella sp. P3-120]|uniref:LPS-assembly protein LptD n=1 Tax=Xylanibacter brevis TaxID=83231 RepID=A0ABS9CFS7_9BACT|nr:LPS-assembly protein LptD [Prevotella sp.]MCF2563735.1 LPS-assembly protein LptD [Xylanibacter brevis]OYP34258.1 kinase [Prevotella sp. P5-126]OYP45135.1 kinase [Prevotella sp. P4-119]OYP46714.1 kinase [Prevotella sp. P4-98]OYP47476.1 kinase [Prevotella sp. P3-120]OYP52876.1 kinase [Prevotella sp. P3-92]